MPTHRGSKTQNKLTADRTSDTIWAAVTILSLPISAMAFTAMDFSPIFSFILGVCITFAIIVIEVLVRGKLWIFQDRFKEAFANPETPFRILIVTGGILLILQTFLIVQIFTNPNIDHFMFNLILRKQCDQNPGTLSDTICPMFMPVRQTPGFALRYSLETQAQQHLIPGSTFASCAVVPTQAWPKLTDGVSVNFFAYCEAWGGTGADGETQTKSALINAELGARPDNFFAVRTWTEDSSSVNFQNLMNDTRLINGLKKELSDRRESMLRILQ